MIVDLKPSIQTVPDYVNPSSVSKYKVVITRSTDELCDLTPPPFFFFFFFFFFLIESDALFEKFSPDRVTPAKARARQTIDEYHSRLQTNPGGEQGSNDYFLQNSVRTCKNISTLYDSLDVAKTVQIIITDLLCFCQILMGPANQAYPLQTAKLNCPEQVRSQNHRKQIPEDKL